MSNPFLKTIIEMFRDTHGCHTAILYGSRAREDETETSDYDVLGVRDEGSAIRATDCPVDGPVLDGFIYPTSDIFGKEKEFLRIQGGIVLFERDIFGKELLKKVSEIFDRGPDPYPPTELKAGKDWIRKMLVRIQKDDPEANFRRHWLLFQLLEDYFHFRNRWFQGVKKALVELQINDPETYRLYSIAVKPEANWAEIEALAERVIQS